MATRSLIDPVPWDTAALGVESFELKEASAAAMAQMRESAGHYAVKVDPLASKRLLHENGFYYCDTLIEPHCTADRFAGRPHADAAVTRDTDLDAVLASCHGAFAHGRFHRDFNVDRARADARYDRWLASLHAQGRVYGLLFAGEPAGFAAVVSGRLVLHAVAERFRGRGLAAGLWTALCRELYAAGEPEITSSISAANLAVLNLYAALGFRFRNPVDVYHRVVPSPAASRS